jgi:hypothetical protein
MFALAVVGGEHAVHVGFELLYDPSAVEQVRLVAAP